MLDLGGGSRGKKASKSSVFLSRRNRNVNVRKFTFVKTGDERK